MAGIDVGEDFLDVAIFSPAGANLNLARIDLGKIGCPFDRPLSSRANQDAISSLRAILTGAVPALRGAIVLVDSPRWPSDLDWSEATHGSCWAGRRQLSLRNAHQPRIVARRTSVRGREIDTALRDLAFTISQFSPDLPLAPLSMFPTPPMRYFGAHLNIPSCKPHLRLLGQAVFGSVLNRDYGPPSGGIFTRFMIAGFATYLALQPIASAVYEGYPDLQFKLWSRGQQLFSKSSKYGRRAALASRTSVLSELAHRLGVDRLTPIPRMDAADAAILALSNAAAQKRGARLIIENPGEGSFLVALDQPEARHLWQSLRPILNDPPVDQQYVFLQQ